MIAPDAALAAFAEEVGDSGPVAVEGGRTRWGRGGFPREGTRLVRAPAGIVEHRPEEMTVRVLAGTTVAEMEEALAASGQRSALPDRGGTIGGALAVGENHTWMLGRGALRAGVLQVRYVSAEGRVVSGGGPTVKNVSGYDVPRLMIGALGTLGLIGDAILRTNPRPAASRWVHLDGPDPFTVRDALHRPGAVLTDGAAVWVLLEGHPADVDDQCTDLCRIGEVTEVDGPPPLPAHRWSVAAGSLRTLDAATTGRFVAAVGTGLMFAELPPPRRRLSAGVAAVHLRMKNNFDPSGRLNPGRDPGTC
jgi:FAD/FMN-containing dehydrogenase